MAQFADVQCSYLGSRLLEVCGICDEARYVSDTVYQWREALCKQYARRQGVSSGLHCVHNLT